MATSCIACTAGYDCSNTDVAPIKCAPGTYKTGTTGTACVTCSAGSYCTDPTTETVCATAHTSSAGATTCKPCPAGQECTSKLDSSISNCATGEYSAEGVATCTQCLVGHYCPNNEYFYRCIEGYYSAAGAEECTACEIGYFCTAGLRYICPFLHYSDTTGNAACREIPTNYIISSFDGATSGNMTGGTAYTKCGPNSHTDDMHWACTDCDTTHMCTQEQQVIPCPYGHAKLNGKWYCTPCPPNSICIHDGSTMVEQTIDDYMIGIASITSFVVNEYNYPRYSAYMELGPRICPPNTYCSEDGLVYRICPHGTYPYHNGCTDCPDGKFCMTSYNRQADVTTGSVSSSADSFPRFEPQGFTWDAGTGFTNTQLRQTSQTSRGKISHADQIFLTCPAGYSCTNSIHQRCPSSHMGLVKTGEEIGCLSENQAVLHNYITTAFTTLDKVPDTDLDQVDTDQCLPCNEGYSCDIAGTTACAVGYYSPAAETKCLICPPGYHCAAKEFEPTACLVNTYNDGAGGSTTADCTACPTGFYSGGAASYCEPCPAGYECSTGTPILCAMGTYSVEGGISCSACQEGYA
jgi:hypothetical protein